MTSRRDPPTQAWLSPVLNSLGDLTNRENRAFSPGSTTPIRRHDGSPDDSNGDGVPDYYPDRYYHTRNGLSRSNAFPYIYPGAYSKPDPASHLRRLDSQPRPIPGRRHDDDLWNHAPLEQGDSLPTPDPRRGPRPGGGSRRGGKRCRRVGTTPSGPISPRPRRFEPVEPLRPRHRPMRGGPLLPAVLHRRPTIQRRRRVDHVRLHPTVANAIWEDDLIMTGVRSFDVKAYDNAFAGYVDLGWGDDIRQPGDLRPEPPQADEPAATSRSPPGSAGTLHRLAPQFGALP